MKERDKVPPIALRKCLASLVLLFVSGCQLWVDDADREVYRLIEQRQLAALGESSDVRLPSAVDSDFRAAGNPYSYVPHPVDSSVPEEFSTSAAEADEQPQQDADPAVEEFDPGLDVGASTDVTEQDRADSPDGDVGAEDAAEFLLQAFEEVPDFGMPFPLREALAYAIENAREYMDSKEDLYLQALALTLERHLWTPLFLSNLSATYTEFPQNSDPDRAMEAIADVAVEQRLPYGGQVVAQWVGTMVRDLENHVTDVESGTAILQADIPLLRGAGRVAYESRYQTERNLIYAVRRYERFRRSFLTRVAAAYFELLSLKTGIRNAIANRDASRDNWERSDALADAERVIRQEADRALVDFLQARNRVINAIEQYESAIDEFKILIGMSTTEEIDVVEQDIPLMEPDVDARASIAVALANRLDLLNTLDRVDDARRGVTIARNNLLPDLDVGGSVSYTTKDDHLSAFDFREDNETWSVGVDLEIPLERKAERNLYRSSLITLRRAERNYEQAADRVSLEVRRALRRIRQARFSLLIQEKNITSNEIRRDAARARFDLGELSNRDVVDADNDLLDARDAYADALSTLRQAILGFRLSTGTLRLTDDGRWQDAPKERP